MRGVRSAAPRLPSRAKLAVSLAVGSAAIAANAPAYAGDMTYQQIADIYAGQVVANGQAVGVGVAIIDGNGPPRFFTYGNAVQGRGSTRSKPFRPGSLFWIGSVSKVFTTNLLGQRVYTGDMRLDQPLSDYATQIGPMRRRTSRMTLKQLASFTGGLLDTPPVCPQPPKPQPPGCLPHSLPDLKEYPVRDFAKYIQKTVPKNFTKSPPKRVKKLPAPWFYSNYSAALVGLLIGGRPDERLSNRAVGGWFRAVRKEILKPLGMDSTFLYVPSDERRREAAGYNQALGGAVVVDGAISQVKLLSPGGGFSKAPKVKIIGGGGEGAKVVARIGPKHGVAGFKVTDGGSGYIVPPVISFRNRGGTQPPKADAIIAGGKVVGVKVLSGGEKLQWAPDVVINGGRKGGRSAALKAFVAGGELTYVRVTDPGSGYVDKLAVAVAPGERTSFPVSPMAPAGFLVSSLNDMAAFARAAFAHHTGIHKALVWEGFRISQRPYACTVGSPSLKTCPATATRSGLGAWMIRPGDPETGWPDIISKDGGIPGYSTFLTMMPERKTAVVVFVNSRPDPVAGVPALPIGQNILNAIYYECRNLGFGTSCSR